MFGVGLPHEQTVWVPTGAPQVKQLGTAKLCSCGKATANMSFAERTEYELEQYRAYKARVASA